MTATRPDPSIDLSELERDYIVKRELGSGGMGAVFLVVVVLAVSVIGLTVALTTAAYVVARRGLVARPGDQPAGPPPIPLPPQDLDVQE